ncbi:hypothetical protein GCM10029992_62890 [Glycomyces albus]
MVDPGQLRVVGDITHLALDAAVALFVERLGGDRVAAERAELLGGGVLPGGAVAPVEPCGGPGRSRQFGVALGGQRTALIGIFLALGPVAGFVALVGGV